MLERLIGAMNSEKKCFVIESFLAIYSPILVRVNYVVFRTKGQHYVSYDVGICNRALDICIETNQHIYDMYYLITYI